MRMKKREKKREWVTLLMFVCFVLGASAQSLSKKFSVSFKNTPLPTALKKIGKQSGVRVEFAYEDVKGYSVSTHLTAVNAESAVKAVIDNRPLTYKVVGDKFIIISRKASLRKATPSSEKPEATRSNEEIGGSYAQQTGKIVKGKVVDENHDPLPGVSVKCGNNRMGTYTNADGEFVFTLPENHVSYLTFSYIGMQEQKVKLSAKNSNHMQIVMHEDAGVIDEVVVTGYQVLDKRSLTSAVTSVKMDELKRADMSSLDQMLEGKIADLMVTNNSAEVGVAPKIRIRGTSTLIGNREPLWVVDGIVVSDQWCHRSNHQVRFRGKTSGKERKSINLKEIIVPGKYNFIDFWASWCGPCRAAIPSVKQLQQKLGDKLNIISISVEKKRQDWERAMEVEKMTFLFGRKSEVIERKNILWRLLNKVLVPVIQKKEDFDT